MCMCACMLALHSQASMHIHVWVWVSKHAYLSVCVFVCVCAYMCLSQHTSHPSISPPPTRGHHGDLQSFPWGHQLTLFVLGAMNQFLCLPFVKLLCDM